LLVEHSRAVATKKLKKVPARALTSPVLRAAAKVRVAQWDRRASDPQEVQVRTLLKHCATAANTEFGREHRLGEVRSYEDFKARVPLRPYAGFEPYLERMRKGARDVLWPGLIPYYGQSSGSSNTQAQHKYLPISMEQIRWQRKAGFDMISRYLMMTGDREFTGGFSLGLFPPSVLKQESPGVHVGSNPGIMLRHVPAPARMLTIPKLPVRDIPDYDQKLAAIASTYLHHDVRSISGTTCWFSIMFDRLLEAARAQGVKADKVGEIWPNLRVLFGGGVHAAPYRKLIDEKVGHPVVLMDNYNATEGGIFSATDRLGKDDMLMLPDRGVFFEFVPREEHGKSDATRFALWQVKTGVDYSVVLTTSSGLFGYYIGDFIRFTSTFPHRMEFAGRASGVLSLTQELTSFIEIEKSFTVATEKHGCTLVDYAASSEVGVDQTGKGRYVFFAEFEKSPRDLDAFVQSVDQELCVQNRVYREHRQGNVAILAPRLVSLPKGTAKKFMEALGYSSVQNKFPRIIDERRRDLLNGLAAENATRA
jgi:hypothetical protein